ncbi:MAG: sugar phosphate isomerase/epimerase, partial [Rhodobiaceae bacterium]
RHPSNDDPQSWTEMCREFDIICDHADRHGVMVGVEPEPANIVCDAGRAVDLLAAFPGGPIRMVLDPANLIEDVAPASHERTIDQALDRLGPMTVLAHAKDRHADGTVAPAGKGVVDWPHFLRGLEACGFDGPLIAHGMSQSDAPAVAEFLTGQVRRRVL